jgi:hypothetical protein
MVMTSHLIVESRDPFESNGFARRCELWAVVLPDGGF